MLPYHKNSAIAATLANFKAEKETKKNSELVQQYLLEKAAPCDQKTISQYLSEVLPDGPIYLYGACSHTQGILPLFERFPNTRILGILDIRSEDIGVFEGHTVLAPNELESGDFHVFVGHPDLEENMIETLSANGFSPDKIIPLYSSKVYLTTTYNHFIARKMEEVGTHFDSENEKIDTVVVTNGPQRWTVIHDSDLSKVFHDDNVLSLYTGKDLFATSNNVFPTIDMCESHRATIDLIKAISPKHVYVRTSFQFVNMCMGLAVAEALPETEVIQEIYDWAMSMPDISLKKCLSMDDQAVKTMRDIELLLLRSNIRIVGKQGGSYWDNFVKETGLDYTLYYPGLLKDRAPPPYETKPDNPKIKLVFAGSMPWFRATDLQPSGWSSQWDDILSIFKKLTECGLFEIDIFNASHTEEIDEFYVGYEKALEDYPINYYSRIPYGELLKRLPTYLYGLMLSNESETDAFPYDNATTTLPNRFMGYIEANLPVICNASLGMAASYLQQYDAGVVVEWSDFADLPEKILQADRQKHQQGITLLHQDMLIHNHNTLQDLDEMTTA